MGGWVRGKGKRETEKEGGNLLLGHTVGICLFLPFFVRIVSSFKMVTTKIGQNKAKKINTKR